MNAYLARDARKNKGVPRPLVGSRRHEFFCFSLQTLALPPDALIGWSSSRAIFPRALSTIVVVAPAVVPGRWHWFKQYNEPIASQTIVPACGKHCVPWPSAPAAGKTEDLSGKHLGNDGRRALGHVRESSRCRARDHGACKRSHRQLRLVRREPRDLCVNFYSFPQQSTGILNISGMMWSGKSFACCVPIR